MRQAFALVALAVLAACDSAAPAKPNFAAYQPDLVAFNAQPENTTGPTPIKLTAYATTPLNKPMEYHWTADNGILSGTTGASVSWRPTNAEGVIQAGVAFITVYATAGGYTTSATIPMRIAKNGSVRSNAGPTLIAVPPSPAASVSPGALPSGTASLDPAASAPSTACAVAALVPTWGSTGSLLYLTGSGLPAKPALTVGSVSVTPVKTSPSALAFLAPRAPDSGVQAISLASCGQGSAGSWTPFDTSDYGSPVSSPAAGLLATVGQADADANTVPDLSKRAPLGSFLVPNLDLSPHTARVPLPLANPSLPTAIRFTGKLAVPSAGLVRFSLVASRGAKLYLDGKLVVDADVGTASNGTDGDAQLVAGPHDLRVDYLQGGTLIGLQLYWTLPGAAEAIVPAGALSPGL